MIAVSDTSPICYLVLIDQINLLPQLYNRIIIPPSVYQELCVSGSPEVVSRWIDTPPTWLEIRSDPVLPEESLGWLDPGERETIALAEQLQADLVLIDEKRARQVAVDRGLNVVGLLGILGMAANEEMIDFTDAIARLQTTNFRASPKLLQRLLERYSKG